jgi:hypothetical protein
MKIDEIAAWLNDFKGYHNLDLVEVLITDNQFILVGYRKGEKVVEEIRNV